MKSIVLLAFVSLLALPCAVQMVFPKVELRTNYGTGQLGGHGSISADVRQIRFLDKKGLEAFSIPSDSVTEIFYSRVAGRRIKTAIFVSPLLLFTKGRKHYLTISFNDGGDVAGAVEFQMHKSNYRGTLRTLEEVTGVISKYDQEGVSADQQGMSSRGDIGLPPVAAVKDGVLSIESTPPMAEVYINGQFNGLTPRKKVVAPPVPT